MSETEQAGEVLEFARKLDSVLEERETNLVRQMTELIDNLKQPDRTALPPTETPEAASDEGFEVNRIDKVVDGREYQYFGMKPDIARFRGVREDLLYREWFNAHRRGEYEERGRIERQIRDIFCRKDELVRAQYAEGAIGAAGASAGNANPFLPVPLANIIILARNLRAKVRSQAQIFTSTARSLRVPNLARATAAIHAEGAGAAEGGGATGEIILDKKKLGVSFDATDETIEDSAFNLVSVFSERAGSAIGAGEDVEFTLTASNVTSEIGNGLTAVDAVVGALAYTDITALYYAVQAPWRQSAIWMGSDTVMQALSEVVDGNSRPLFTPSVARPAAVGDEVVGEEGRIFNRPVISLPFDNADALFFGSLSGVYGVLDGGGIRVKVDELPATDTTIWYFSERIDGGMVGGAATDAEAMAFSDGIT